MTARLMARRVRVILLTAAMLMPASIVQAGGPRYVAGTSFFDRTTAGTPVVWASGAINYYTDPGGLSASVPETAADQMVATAFSRWTSVATAAVSAANAGNLDEDVNGANLFRNSDNTITMPDDIAPTATDKPLAVVYDADGSVTDALMGTGAGDASNCFIPDDGNAVFGGPDNFSADAHLTHALVVINGNCLPAGAPASQLQDVEYRLVRVLGRVLGLDWSQANLDPGAQDIAGFPVMHAYDPPACVPISSCYANADLPRLDDRAALSRLYPVTQANISAFPGKSLFQPNTVRIHGTVYFADPSGLAAQPMQGVNVVARLIDPGNPANSRVYVASSVSGFRFCGNAGNPVTGFTDEATGLRYDRFGSDDLALEGFYDLDGLEVPDPSGIAEYQISVEALSPVESRTVGPYAPWQVRQSGSAAPQLVTITLGNDIQQDMIMNGSAITAPDSFGPQSFAAPASVPGAGDWTGALSSYGDVQYFQFPGLAGRTLTVETTALDAAGQPTQSKAMPVVGLWAMADTGGLPELASPEVFNGPLPATTRLDASLGEDTAYRVGIADYRGDGRPDYRYHARIFYGGQVTPPRAGVAGGTPLLIQGLGFRGNTTVSIGGANAPVLGLAAGKVQVSAPPLADGVKDISLGDPVTGASSVMSGAVIYGAGPGDSIRRISTTNKNQAPLGGVVPSPVMFQVVGPDQVTPVAGASVVLQAAPATLTACGASTCKLLTDDSGIVSSQVAIPASVPDSAKTAGIAVVAQLAPDTYSPPQQAQTTVLVSSPPASASPDISMATQFIWVPQGATLDLPVTARVLLNGAPQSGQTLKYFESGAQGTLNSPSAVTDASGFGTVTLHVSGATSQVQVTACVDTKALQSCPTLTATPVAASSLRLQPVAGLQQAVSASQGFQPVAVRVVDTLGNPVQGAEVEFQAAVMQAGSDPPGVWIGDTNIDPGQPPVILATYQITAPSDASGVAQIQPPSSEIANVVVVGTASAGVASVPFKLTVAP